MELKQAVKELRKSLGLSQQRFALRVGDGVSVAALQRWEAGISRPHPGSLVRLYHLALDNNRGDLAGLFASGDAPSRSAGTSVPAWHQRLPEIGSYIADINMNLARAQWDPSLTCEEKAKLIASASEAGSNCMVLWSQISREANS